MRHTGRQAARFVQLLLERCVAEKDLATLATNAGVPSGK
jgi:hypothetical protein